MSSVPCPQRVVMLNCSARGFYGAGGGTRTHTVHMHQRILSPLRLPLPPPRQSPFRTAQGRFRAIYHAPNGFGLPDYYREVQLTLSCNLSTAESDSALL